MDFPEQVLDLLEVVAPALVFHGKKVLDAVAESLDDDAKAMECGLRAVAEGAIVQLASLGPALQGEVLEERAAGADAGRTRGKRVAPAAPLLAVEFFQRSMSFTLLFLLAAFEDFEQGLASQIYGAG